MNEKNIQYIVVSFALLLLSIIVIQVYWAKNALKLRQDNFTDQVNKALQEVVVQLEKLETIENLRSHETARFLFFANDSLQHLPKEVADSNIQYLSTQKIRKSSLQPLILEVESSVQSGKNRKQSLQQVLVEEGATIDSSLKKSSLPLTSVDAAEEVKSLLSKKFEHKTAFVGDIVRRLMQVDMKDMSARVDSILLDSLLKHAFNKYHVKGQYEYGIYRYDSTLCLGSSKAKPYHARLVSSPYYIGVFPNDLVASYHSLRVYFKQTAWYLLESNLNILFLSGVIILAMIYVFYKTISTIIYQRKLSDIKNDFINNMTHELKTPISTIHLAYQALTDKDFVKDADKQARYLSMIGDENKRLEKMVQKVLQHASLEKGEYSLEKESIDAHEWIRQSVEAMSLFIQERKGSITLNLDASSYQIMADKVHLTNVLYNLLDNALKYASQAPHIAINTRNDKNQLVVEVQDDGIGIKKEYQSLVFEKLYRVPTGNIHNVKGFGLGLSYVKQVIEKHGGSIKLESEFGKGSKFLIFLPL